MTVRNDITVDFTLSPRLIKIAAPSTNLSMQDLVDTVRSIEDDLTNMDDPHLLNASGKEDLGGGVVVGITIQLQNAQVEFEGRTAPTSGGIVTSAGTLSLTDSSATFLLDGVTRGAQIINFSDFSVSIVLSIASETQLTHTPFESGTLNQWTIGDTYRIVNEIQCEASGGNLTAVDQNISPINAIFPSIGTQIVRASSSSATIAGLEIQNIQRLIESARDSHHAYGSVFYWDPFGGSDLANGLNPSTAKKTFDAVQALCTPIVGDVIFALNGNPSGATIVTDPVRLTVARVSIRGPGRAFNIIVDNGTAPAVWIDAPGASLEGVAVKQLNAAQPGLLITTHNVLIQRLLVGQCAGDGIEITNTVTLTEANAAVTIFDKIEVIDNARHGIHIHNNVGLTFIKHSHVEESGVDGIRMETNVDDVHVTDTIVHESLGWGINIINNTVSNTALINTSYINNALGNLTDGGVNTVIIDGDAKAIWDWQTTATTLTGSMGEYIQKKVLSVSKFLGLK